MEYLYKFRDELMELKKNNIETFTIDSSDKTFETTKLINEIDSLRLCVCPPKQ